MKPLLGRLFQESKPPIRDSRCRQEELMRVLVKANQSFRFAAALAPGLIITFVVPAAAAGTTKATTHTVVIDGVRFEPETLVVKVGDTVVWVNKDPFPHTATSKAGRFDSHEIAAGKTWRFTPKKAGVFPYACTLHPSMKATLTVE